jgi:ribosomal protein S18 acetylase RimI-like enzyme
VGVVPKRRGQGLGTRLVHFAEERILREAPNVFLCVSSFNTRAQKFYRRLGYERIGELRDFIVPGHAEILMRKTVAPLTEFRWPTDDSQAPEKEG